MFRLRWQWRSSHSWLSSASQVFLDDLFCGAIISDRTPSAPLPKQKRESHSGFPLERFGGLGIRLKIRFEGQVHLISTFNRIQAKHLELALFAAQVVRLKIIIRAAGIVVVIKLPA